MNRRVSTILLLALLVATACSFLVYRVAARQISAARPSTVKIVVAAHNFEIGTLIRDSDVVLGDWVGVLPKGAITSKSTVIGRGVVSALYEGEPVLEARLAPAGSGGGLAATIRPGMRACAVKVDEVVGVAGFVVPGMRVDVLISGTLPSAPATEGPKVKTLLQNIEVLSAGTNIQKDNEGKPAQVQVVNLLVDPEQAELLSLASNQTKIQLVLRNPLDTEKAEPPSIAMARLFADSNAPPVKPQGVPAERRPIRVVHAEPALTPAPVHVIEILNGSKRTQEKFSSTEQNQ